MMILSEKGQTIHRAFNTILAICIIIVGLLLINPIIESVETISNDLTGVTEQRITKSEIAQIASDEGYRACYYKDSLGQGTIGFGTLVNDTMKAGDCINPHNAIALLREHYNIAKHSVEKRYPWASGEARLVLINLSYNMGETRLSGFKNTLSYLRDGELDLSAGELLDSNYAKQVPNRAGRMAGRIMAIQGD